MKAYKLVRKLKNGQITPLFINRTKRLPFGEWMVAEKNHHRDGFSYRPFWHCTELPIAPHLSIKDRVWVEIEMGNYTEYQRPEHQGGKWFLADNIKIIKEI